MPPGSSFRRACLAVVSVAALSLQSCDQLTLPRLTHEESPAPVAPITVDLIFDPSLREATVEQTVCADIPWSGALGRTIEESFLAAGRKRFARVLSGPPEARPAGIAPDVSVFLTLVRRSFTARTRTGSEEHYLAHLDVELSATYRDPQGRTLAAAPLIYSDDVSIYTPLVTRSDCATGALDAALRKAAEHMAGQMVKVLYRLGQPPRDGTTTAAAPPAGQAAPALAIRATLLDENENLLLESGEKIGIRIDVTNTAGVALSSVSMTLSGTPTLIQAFSHALDGPVQIPLLGPGETKSTIVWGRMPAVTEAGRGELTVSVTTAGGGLPQAQTLVAAVRPSPIPRPATPARKESSRPPVAVLVEIARYRDSRMEPPVASVVHEASGRLGEQVLVLKDEEAMRLDLEEALGEWLPERAKEDRIVLFYFSGQALVDARTGKVFLVPYDGKASVKHRRLVPLEAVHAALGKLPGRLALLLLDVTVTEDGPAGGKTKAADWLGGLGVVKARAGAKPAQGPLRVVQVIGQPAARGQLLSWLDGRADQDHDGYITVGEMLASLKPLARVLPSPSLSPQDLALPLLGVTPQP